MFKEMLGETVSLSYKCLEGSHNTQLFLWNMFGYMFSYGHGRSNIFILKLFVPMIEFTVEFFDTSFDNYITVSAWVYSFRKGGYPPILRTRRYYLFKRETKT